MLYVCVYISIPDRDRLRQKLRQRHKDTVRFDFKYFVHMIVKTGKPRFVGLAG